MRCLCRWVSKDNGLEYILSAKKHIQQIYAEYVQECKAKGEVPISRSSFYSHCVPDNFYYERFEKCCCSACKKGTEALINLKQLVRAVMDSSGMDRDTKRQRMDQILRLECHCNINLQTVTSKHSHPPPIPAQHTQDTYNEQCRALMNRMEKANSRAQLENMCDARDLPKSVGTKRKLVENIINHDIKEAGYHTGCDLFGKSGNRDSHCQGSQHGQ